MAHVVRCCFEPTFDVARFVSKARDLATHAPDVASNLEEHFDLFLPAGARASTHRALAHLAEAEADLRTALRLGQGPAVREAVMRIAAASVRIAEEA